MTTINLRDFYPWYTHDEYMELSDEIVDELFRDKRYRKAHERTIRRNKVYSLDAEDGTEMSAIVISANSPDAILAMMERHCRLCRALNSLPEIQGRRIDAHYIQGMSQREIAETECVSEVAVHKSIQKGLQLMKKYLKKGVKF